MAVIVAKVYIYVLTHIQSVNGKLNNILASSQSPYQLSLQEKWNLGQERVEIAVWILAA